MPDERRELLPASAHGHADTRLEARVLAFARGERWRRAARAFLPLFGAALLSVPIPAWHIAAVPGFLVAAVVLGVRALREKSRIDSLRGPCPACSQPQAFPLSPRERLPAVVRCPACGEFVKIG